MRILGEKRLGRKGEGGDIYFCFKKQTSNYYYYKNAIWHSLFVLIFHWSLCNCLIVLIWQCIRCGITKDNKTQYSTYFICHLSCWAITLKHLAIACISFVYKSFAFAVHNHILKACLWPVMLTVLSNSKQIVLDKLYFFGYKAEFFLPKQFKDLDPSCKISRSLKLFRKGKIGIIAKFHRTDLVIWCHSRGTKTLSYSRINTVHNANCKHSNVTSTN